jgi:hypothetical protein
MLYAVRTGLTLVVALVVTQAFLPQVAVRLVTLIVAFLDIVLGTINHTTFTLPS